MKKLILLVLLAIALIPIIYTYVIKKPSNDRQWEYGLEIPPEVKINNDQVTIKNIRDWSYSKTETVSNDYIERTYNADNISKVWFLVEPFSKFDGIAHTYFVFDFTDQEPISFSIEARREKGEAYHAELGAFNIYELIYLWGTERDFTGRRIYKDNADVYMYPLDIKHESAKNLFLKFANVTEDLRINPQFYNTLTSNCTNNLAKYANEVKPGSIPWHYSFILPGYSDEYLYKLKYISNDLPLEDTKKKHYITDIVKETYTDKNFSAELRKKLE